MENRSRMSKTVVEYNHGFHQTRGKSYYILRVHCFRLEDESFWGRREWWECREVLTLDALATLILEYLHLSFPGSLLAVSTSTSRTLDYRTVSTSTPEFDVSVSFDSDFIILRLIVTSRLVLYVNLVLMNQMSNIPFVLSHAMLKHFLTNFSNSYAFHLPGKVLRTYEGSIETSL